MYPTLTAAGNMRRVYNKKNSPQDTLDYITRQEELRRTTIQKAKHVGITILIRGTDPTHTSPITKEETMAGRPEPPLEQPLSPDTMFDTEPIASPDHDEIDEFFNTVSEEAYSQYSQYGYSSGPS
ncbi:hypothetical protein INT47_003192 [Mucor saturninus]|uniref:Uncharacterized protein n=1 Tax=Mucor saturninus TaxID=64648 RepID=A0A8H7QY81_9FUNG|nr:hypothetical protein INT47_003192 [Mucor saturninus]